MNLYKIWTVHIRMWSPREIRVFAILFALVVLFLCRLVKRHKMNCRQAVAGGILFLFLGLVYASTVFTRGIIPRDYKLVPFWSWRHIFRTGDLGLLPENILNGILLFPMGILLPVIAGHKVKPGIAFGMGLAVSAFIECSQLIFMRGTFEWDDMIHNAVGCMLGCIVTNVVGRSLKLVTRNREDYGNEDN